MREESLENEGGQTKRHHDGSLQWNRENLNNTMVYNGKD